MSLRIKKFQSNAANIFTNGKLKSIHDLWGDEFESRPKQHLLPLRLMYDIKRNEKKVLLLTYTVENLIFSYCSES